MLGRDVLLPATLIAAPPDEIKPTIPYNITFQNNMREAHQQVRESLGSSARTMKNYFNRRVSSGGATLWQSSANALPVCCHALPVALPVFYKLADWHW